MSPATVQDGPSRLPDTYLEVASLEDGRYCVQLIKQGVMPRKSYTPNARDVVNQAVRAGHVPVHTQDEELRRICRDYQVELIP